MPKWATPSRQRHLLRLWAKYGNRCSQGHYLCLDREHYLRTRTRVVTIAVPAPKGVEDKRTGLLKPGVFLMLWKPKVVVESRKVLTFMGAYGSPLYEEKAEEYIRYWVEDDRAQRDAEWRRQRVTLHHVPDARFRQGQFDTIRREQFLEAQPPYYLEATGIDALTYRPIAKVRIPSTPIRLFVDIDEALQGTSKNKRHKAVRYGKLSKAAYTMIEEAVKDWEAKHS